MEGSHWATSSTTCTSKCYMISRKDGKKQLSNKQTSQGYIVSRKGCQLGQWSYYKAFEKSSLPFGLGWHAFGQDASNASHKREGFVGPSHACHGFSIQFVFHFSHVFFWKYKHTWLGSKAQEMIFFIMCKNVQCIRFEICPPTRLMPPLQIWHNPCILHVLPNIEGVFFTKEIFQ